MIAIGITETQIEQAEHLYPFDKLNGSITKGKSNIYGAIGEIVARDYMSRFYSVTLSNTYDYDLIVNGSTVDVKTKRTTVAPKPHYYCSISAWNIHQNCDYYCFVRVLENKQKAFLIGLITKQDFFNRAVYKQKGELDTNGFSFKDNCYNVPISEIIRDKII